MKKMEIIFWLSFTAACAFGYWLGGHITLGWH